MSFVDEVRKVVAVIVAGPLSDMAVTVESGSETATGSTLSDEAVAAAGLYGEDGVEVSGVRVDASLISEPKQGASIKVGGEAVTVLSSSKDPLGTFRVIAYQKQRPIKGV